jgi:peptidoglycan-N-acetylglucosamine deacetylase
MRLFRPFSFTGWLYPGAVRRIRTSDRLLWLTFDDGPNPESTPQLLDILKRSNIKAVFFCNGAAAEKYPHILNAIIANGHVIGNHGYDHRDGWSVDLKEYITDVERASHFTSTILFRPPYGHMTLAQYRRLCQSYKVILWDIMPYDFDNSLQPEDSLRILFDKIRTGSVIVLHDTPASSVTLFLEVFISGSLERGFGFGLPDTLCDPKIF